MGKRRTFYAVATIALFAIEVLIALYVQDWLIRPYVGDSIVVILLYTALRAMTPLDVRPAAAAAFAFACAVEVGQYFNLVDLLGLGHSALARTLLGTNFELRDFIAYAFGAVIVLVVEWAWSMWASASGRHVPHPRSPWACRRARTKRR